ncbi:hypothetical protein AB0C76_32960 [Kitasatospora sp. NPDC048722]|uniref:hypothetical protein n=1 Tax=Kitasatospora sp. NPDC048722 TaxID=3155639 RepID=UPI0033EAE94D
MTHDDDRLPTVEQLRTALAALGFSNLGDHPGGSDRVFLLGALLAMAETHSRKLERTELDKAAEGFLSVLIAYAGGDPRGAARGWAVVLGDRINRTAVELHEAVDGEGRMFTDVAGPAMLVASNLLNLLNRSEIDQETVTSTIAYADQNLKAARKNLGEMREQLRRQGFKL